MSTKFHMQNSRAAKVNGEMVMWIRREYAAMKSYPVIREGLQAQFGVLLSVQQITRIAKGHSFAQLPTLPTDREVDLTMHVNALKSQGLPQPSQEQVAASIAKVQSALAEDEKPQPSILDILENRLNLSNRRSRVPTLEEIEDRERAAMGVSEGAGLNKLIKTVEAESQPAQAQVNAEKLLETLKDEHYSNHQSPNNSGVSDSQRTGIESKAEDRSQQD